MLGINPSATQRPRLDNGLLIDAIALGKYRIPEPTRQADIEVAKMKVGK